MKRNLISIVFCLLACFVLFSCSTRETDQVVPVKSSDELHIRNNPYKGPFRTEQFYLSGKEGCIKVWKITYEYASNGKRFNRLPLIDSLRSNKFYWLPNGRIVE